MGITVGMETEEPQEQQRTGKVSIQRKGKCSVRVVWYGTVRDRASGALSPKRQSLLVQLQGAFLSNVSLLSVCCPVARFVAVSSVISPGLPCHLPWSLLELCFCPSFLLERHDLGTV